MRPNTEEEEEEEESSRNLSQTALHTMLCLQLKKAVTKKLPAGPESQILGDR